MFICDECYDCVDCNWKSAKKLSDIDKESRSCPHLIEVAPVIHAHWIMDKTAQMGGLPYCSHCHQRSHSAAWGDEDNYCGICGAKMDEEI